MSLGSEGGRNFETSSSQKAGLQSITGAAEQPVCDQVGLTHSQHSFLHFICCPCSLSVTVIDAHCKVATADKTYHLKGFVLS